MAGFTVVDAPVLDLEPSYDEESTPCEDCGGEVAPTPSGRRYRKCTSCRGQGKSSSSTPQRASGRAANWEKSLGKELTDLVDGIGQLVSLADPFDGTVIRSGAPKLGTAMVGPARQNPKVRAVLERIVEGGTWGAVIMAISAIVLPILLHHGMIPATVFGKPAAGAPPFDPSRVGHVSV